MKQRVSTPGKLSSLRAGPANQVNVRSYHPRHVSHTASRISRVISYLSNTRENHLNIAQLLEAWIMFFRFVYAPTEMVEIERESSGWVWNFPWVLRIKSYVFFSPNRTLARLYISNIRAFATTCSPTDTFIRLTLPSISARISCCIFMASKMARR